MINDLTHLPRFYESNYIDEVYNRVYDFCDIFLENHYSEEELTKIVVYLVEIIIRSKAEYYSFNKIARMLEKVARKEIDFNVQF